MSKTTNEIHQARPLSPHLSIYRRQISSGLSIFHRATGIGLFLGLFIISWGVILYAFTDCKSCITHITGTILFKIFAVLFSFAAFFHLSTGIRHLFWDVGVGFSIKAMNMSGIVAICASGLMTLIFWLWIYV
jgi:succinate dehydrogenase / fumarate reductase, cytochrome b subunit